MAGSCWLFVVLFAGCQAPKKQGESCQCADQPVRHHIVKCADGSTVGECGRIANQIKGYADLLAATNFKLESDGNADGASAPTSVSVNGVDVDYNTLALELDYFRGFKYSPDDFRSIVCYVDSINGINGQADSIKSVYSMMAINTDPLSVAHRKTLKPIRIAEPGTGVEEDFRIIYLDLYFQATTKSGAVINFIPKRRLAGPDSEEYADFPDPCPSSCPPPPNFD